MIEKISYETVKTRITSFRFQRYENEIDRPQYGIKCWSVYRFKKFVPNNHPLFTLQLVFLSIMLYTLSLEIEVHFLYYFK